MPNTDKLQQWFAAESARQQRARAARIAQLDHQVTTAIRAYKTQHAVATQQLPANSAECNYGKVRLVKRARTEGQ